MGLRVWTRPLLIDSRVSRQLKQMPDHDGVDVLFEFCRCAMYKQNRIRNPSAFLNRMLAQKRRHHRSVDNRSTSVASAHYSLTSVASGLSHCSDFGQESQLS